ncbi:MAG TPA: hypothetical protein VFN20_13460 [Candidatus Acidoferrum sp.]|nr:hypothetical protein [Candidatus Acidoferrum sp.]
MIKTNGNIVRIGCVAAFVLASFSLSSKTNAQAPPGPLPGAASQDSSPNAPARAAAPNVPRIKNLAGTWKLNTDDSDDPHKKLQQARGGGRGKGGGRPSIGIGGGGWPGGGGYGGRRAGGGESDEERQKMLLFLQPAQQLNIAQKEPEIDIGDDSDRKFTAFTDGRKVEKSKDPGTQQFDAKWDEYRLVMEGKDPRGNKYERSYEVLEGNQQLRETLLLKVGRNNTEISIRYIYDLVSAPKKS